MANTIISPNRYVQGRGELKNLPEHAKKLGKKLFVIISASGLKRVRDLLEKSFENTGMELVFEEFQGECCETEIKRLGSRFQENKCARVVGVGGGKIHDSAKAAAYYQGAPVVIIPTIASTDAPCSALSVIYSETGVFERYLFLNSNPDLVLLRPHSTICEKHFQYDFVMKIFSFFVHRAKFLQFDEKLLCVFLSYAYN